VGPKNDPAAGNPESGIKNVAVGQAGEAVLLQAKGGHKKLHPLKLERAIQ
jgi:hypothetical protein